MTTSIEMDIWDDDSRSAGL